MTMVPFSGAERRALARWRTLQRGRVCYGLGYAITLDCVIRNLTESGAMIRVPASQPIPDTFALLHVPGGIAFEAKLSWRRGDDAGAEFIARHDLKGAVEDEFKPLRAVWVALAPA